MAAAWEHYAALDDAGAARFGNQGWQDVCRSAYEQRQAGQPDMDPSEPDAEHEVPSPPEPEQEQREGITHTGPGVLGIDGEAIGPAAPDTPAADVQDQDQAEDEGGPYIVNLGGGQINMDRSATGPGATVNNYEVPQQEQPQHPDGPQMEAE